jgi:hypothetical protein
MSSAAASGSSRSAAPWACRRPPTTRAARASPSGERWRTSASLPDRRAARHEPLRLRLPAYVEGLRRAGEPVARCTVQRLMREQGIQGAKRRGKPWRTTNPTRRRCGGPYLVGRDFSAAVPIGWVADLSYLRCWEGLVFSPSCSTPSAAEGPHRGARSNVVRDGGPALSSARGLRRRLATAAAAGTREQSHRFRPRPGVRLHGEASPTDPGATRSRGAPAIVRRCLTGPAVAGAAVRRSSGW